MAHRLEPGDMPSSLVGEGASEGEHVDGGAHVDAPGLGAAPMHMGPWNRKEHPSRSGSGSEARSSYCPRRMVGSFVGCSVTGYLTGKGVRE